MSFFAKLVRLNPFRVYILIPPFFLGFSPTIASDNCIQVLGRLT